jgi:hypothetical protein
MTIRISRRNFLELSLAALVSACAPKSSISPTPTATAIQPTETPFDDTTPRVYEPDNPNLLYTGRIDFSNAKQPKFSAPGVYIQASFRGSDDPRRTQMGY